MHFFIWVVYQALRDCKALVRTSDKTVGSPSRVLLCCQLTCLVDSLPTQLMQEKALPLTLPALRRRTWLLGYKYSRGNWVIWDGVTFAVPSISFIDSHTPISYYEQLYLPQQVVEIIHKTLNSHTKLESAMVRLIPKSFIGLRVFRRTCIKQSHIRI